jgi:hypothetical protein
MELVVRNKIWKNCLQMVLESFLHPVPKRKRQSRKRPLTEVVDVVVQRFDGVLFPFIVAQKVEFLGEKVVYRD